MRFLTASLSLLAFCAAASAQQELFVHGGDGVIYRIDNYATQPTPVMMGTAAPLNGDLPTDMAIDPVSGDYFMTVFPGGNPSGSFTYRVDQNTFVASQVGGFNFFSLNSLEFTPDGRLFGNGFFVFGMVHIDLNTGGHTFITNRFDSETAGDVATTLDGKFILTTSLGDIEMYDPVSGLVSNLGPHGFGGDAFGLEVDTDGTVYILLSGGDIYTYDLDTSMSTFVGSTGLEIFGAAFRLPAGPDLGDAFGFCQETMPNSTGLPGRISVTGSTVAADNDMTLLATDVPPDTFGIFMAGQFTNVFGGAVNVGQSDGTFCLGGQGVGLFRAPSRIQSSGANGQFSLTIDLTSLPANTGVASVTAGGQLGFQAWFRDTGMNGSNLTNATYVFFR